MPRSESVGDSRGDTAETRRDRKAGLSLPRSESVGDSRGVRRECGAVGERGFLRLARRAWRFTRGAQEMRRSRGAGFSLPRSESVGDSRGDAAETRRGRDACVSYNCIGWSGETADAGDLKSLGAIRTGSNPVFSMRSLSSVMGFFLCPQYDHGRFRDAGADNWSRRATALCVTRCRSGKGLRRRFNRLDWRAMKAAARLRRLAATSDCPVRFSMPLRKMTCTGAPTGLTGAQ